MRGRVPAALVACAGAVAAFAVPAVASADTAQVTMPGISFAPAQLSILVGDTVSWHNLSISDHTVTARDGSFGSPGRIPPHGGYSFQFPAAGSYPYVCLIHPFMTGQVDVYPLLLEGPKDPVAPGTQVTLAGRAEAGTSSVEIQQDSGSGFAPVATAAVDSAGAFHVSLRAASSARYRAVAAAGSSPAVQVVVVDRKVVVAASRRGGKALIRVHVAPRDPGAIVVLQLQLRERFGWWPVARRKLDKDSSAVFGAPLGARARVVLTLPDGWTPVKTSTPVRLPKRG